jgi:uncharacterized membrane protein (UPF0127 family)
MMRSVHRSKRGSFLRIAWLFAGIVFISACSQKTTDLVIHAATGDHQLQVEVAQSAAAQQRGLMYRQSLGKDSGMLFIFDEQEPLTFWMKNTMIPLDILFVSSELVIVDITTMQPCTFDPCPVYTSRRPAKYAVEVNAGYVRTHAIKIGDTVSSDVLKIKK